MNSYLKIKRLLGGQLLKRKILANFEKEFKLFNSLDTKKKLVNDWADIYPCIHDKTKETSFDAHYIYHPAWATRIIKQINPAKHIDISSTLHFCSMLSAYVPTEFYDYRPANLTLSGLISGKADLTSLFFPSNSIDSLSCMHTVEHVGLGRYGDQIDPEGDVKAIRELQRVTRVGGNLLFVTPVGKPRIQFNAHRIYSFELINDLFTDFELKNFSLVDDSGNFFENADPAMVQQFSYGCGCFWYVKKQ
ncbi:DUF268 domain-containing protein [Segetibacter koreensis]|uniref:DUF268 domain-containing protein n=1 Tax=Segetibacter koreensis TaxID=398037 RepID=UPI000367B042|nr:DUF268 domain-containing protein [Segetibacter koreensis]